MPRIELPDDIQKLNVLRVNIKVLQFLGFFRTSCIDIPHWKQIVQRCLKYSIGITAFIFCFGALVEGYRCRYYPLEVIEAITAFLTCLKALIKYLSFTVHEKEFKEIVEHCDDNFIIEGNDLSERQKKIISKDMATTKKATYLFWFMAIVTLVTATFNIFPLSEQEIENSDRDFLPAWGSLNRYAIPLQSARSPYFFIRVLYCTFVDILACVPFIILNTMSALVITYLTIQFAVLSDSLKNIEENVEAVLERGGSQFVTQGQCRLEDDWHENRVVVPQNEAFHLEIERYLRCCIKHHQKLLQFFEVLNNVMRTTLFVDILVASVLISMLSFSFLISSDFSNVIQNIGILYFITIELWFFCWLGTRLSTQSEMIGEAIWSCAWYKQRIKFQQRSTFILMRAQRPVGIYIHIFGTVSLELFSKIMNAAYSYFTIIKQMI
ncbi:Odorant receptor 45 [Blattella germanica]|nr:Odorant receptor 45 [Blattella germanica]